MLGEYELIVVDSPEQAIALTCRLSKAEKILFGKEKNAYSKKPIYCATE